MKKLLPMILGIVLVCGSAYAVDYEYVGGANGVWADNQNWSPVGVPGAPDAAHIGNSENVVLGGTITVGELVVDNGSGMGNTGWGGSYNLIVTDTGGASGDFIYASDADSQINHSGMSFNWDVAGNLVYESGRTKRWNFPGSATNRLILRGANKRHTESKGNSTDFNFVDVYGSYYDNGSDFAYTSIATVTVKSGGQLLGRPDDVESTWLGRRFIFEDGQANMPGYGSDVNFQYQCSRTDNGTGKLVVAGGVSYPLDLAVGQNYWGSSTAITPYEWRLTGGDISVARDFFVRNPRGLSNGTFILDTADNVTDASNNVTVGNDFQVGTGSFSTTEVYGVKLNDSTVKVGRNLIFGQGSTAYYSWTRRNSTRVDLGSATIRVGGEFKIYRMDNDALAAWNGGTSTIIVDGNGTGDIPSGWPYNGRQNIRTWGDESPLHTMIIDTPGNVRFDNYRYGDAAGGDNRTTSLYLTGDFWIKDGNFDQNNVPIIFNGPEHLLQDDNGSNPLDQIELLADAVVLLGSDITMGDLTMGTASKMYLDGFTLATSLDTYSGDNMTWSVGDGTIFGGGLVIPGDSNGDGKVDGGDLAIWQQNYDPLGGGNNTFALGDWNGDGKIDGGDLALWQQNYDPIGPTGADGMGANVPEPTTLLLLGTGLAAGIGVLRRRRMK